MDHRREWDVLIAHIFYIYFCAHMSYILFHIYVFVPDIFEYLIYLLGIYLNICYGYIWILDIFVPDIFEYLVYLLRIYYGSTWCKAVMPAMLILFTSRSREARRSMQRIISPWDFDKSRCTVIRTFWAIFPTPPKSYATIFLGVHRTSFWSN